MKVAALFSGQGSQYPGMGRELYEEFAQVRRVYECGSDILGFDVKKVSFEGTEEELASTLVAQPVIFTLSVACWEVAKELLPPVAAVAGHSLGEYAALCCGGAYSLEDGFRLIAARAKAMEAAASAASGAMYAIIGGSGEEIDEACRQVPGDVEPVNYNQPGQTVISGEAEAAAQAAALLEQQGKRVIKLAVSSAFHTRMMQPAADMLREEVGDVTFRPLAVDFYSNLTGGKLVVEDYPGYFAKHMVSPVRFVEQVAAMAEDGVTACVELGPKKTVAGFAKKNARSLTVCNVEDVKSLRKAQEALQQA